VTNRDRDVRIYRALANYGMAVHAMQIRFKDESFSMRALGKLLFFNNKFTSSFTTTIGRTIYFPSRQWCAEDPGRASSVLAHELVHIDQYAQWNLGFVVGYLFPQVLALLSVLAIWFGPVALAFLLFLLPLPAPLRARFEAQAYNTSIAVAEQIAQVTLTPLAVRSMAVSIAQANFSSANYYYMWPWTNSAAQMIMQCETPARAALMAVVAQATQEDKTNDWE
jgi:hypothetical protein